MVKYDFSGWVTKANLKCTDGRVIMKDAFKHQDGAEVPLVWSHQHNDVNQVLGKVQLENRDEGLYGYCSFNDTNNAETARLLVKHGDVNAMSIHAIRLKQNMNYVQHGDIKEVSLVLAGANPGALIDNIIMHGEESEEEAIIYSGERELEMFHADEKKEEKSMADEKKQGGSEETVADVFNTLNEKQKTVVYAMIGQALEEAGANDDDDDSEGGNEMKHNVFDNDSRRENYLSHADQEQIISLAKSSGVGSLQAAIEMYTEGDELMHDAVSGFAQTGEGNITTLFPEYKDVRANEIDQLTNDQSWIGSVISKTHKTPFSRIRTRHVDIRNIQELRAKGYDKGKRKEVVGNYNLVTRTTDPQTIYVKSALHRDDLTDITDLDIAAYQYKIDRMMLNEELANAIMFGDGRDSGAEGKIEEDKIRPIWLDDELYTRHIDVDFNAAKTELQGTGTGVSFGENYIKAEAMINACLYAREKHRGSGTPDMYITPHELNVMLLARDMNGRRIYSSKSELAQALNVGAIHTVEQMEGKTRVDDKGKTKKLYCLIVNLADYSVGATKGGEITHFTQFDIDFNQQKSLLETRLSGALTRVYSAIAIEEEVTE